MIQFGQYLGYVRLKRRISLHETASYLGVATIENHYFDQVHFIKEFSHFTGLTPDSYMVTGSTCSKLLHPAQ